MRYLSTLFIILLFAACGHDSIPTQMQVAEAIMQERPDSALQLLDSIDTAALTTDEQRALYALLLTQARDKNYFLETDDSLISTAIDYYTRQGNKNREQLARYYKGEILYHKRKYGEAVTEALKSLEITKENKDWFEIGRSHQTIADAYHDTYNSSQAIIHRDSAFINFLKAGKTNFAVYSLIDLADEAIHKNDIEKAKNVFKTFFEICPKNDSVAIGMMEARYVHLYMKLNNNDEAINHFYLHKKYLGDRYPQCQIYSTVAYVFMNNNNDDSAKYYLEKERLVNPDYANSLLYNLVSYRLAKNSNNYAEALNFVEKIKDIDNHDINTLIDNNAAVAEKDFYNQKALDERYKSVIFKGISILIICIAIILICFLYAYHRFKLKNQRIENEKKIYQIKLFVEEQGDLLKKLFSERFSEIDNLCSKYFKYTETNKPVSNIVKDVEKQFSLLKESENMTSLQNYVNHVNDNLINKFKSNLPDLKETDYQFITYKLAGFSPRSICLLMDISTQNYYTKCNRLRNKVEKSESKYKDELLEALKN